MLIRPTLGVVPTVSRSGQLELFSPATGKRFHCSPMGTARVDRAPSTSGEARSRRGHARGDLAGRSGPHPDVTCAAAAGEFREAGLISIRP